MARTIRGTVTSVYDGDTFTLLADTGEEIKIRLIGVDTPEIKGSQRFAIEARNRTRHLILNKEVAVKAFQEDRFGRTLGSVHVDRGNLSVILVREGLAKVYRKSGAVYGHIRDDLDDAEDDAQKRRLGVWS